MAEPRTRRRKQSTRKSTTASDNFVVAGGSSTNFTLGASVNTDIPNGPTKLFLIDYISAFIAFKGNFVQDPVFFLDFRTGGDSGEHAFPAERVPTTAQHPEGYQLYVVSRQVQIAVDGGTGVSFYGEYMPAGVGATANVHISGHFV
jgi:hypothetical protein